MHVIFLMYLHYSFFLLNACCVVKKCTYGVFELHLWCVCIAPMVYFLSPLYLHCKDIEATIYYSYSTCNKLRGIRDEVLNGAT